MQTIKNLIWSNTETELKFDKTKIENLCFKGGGMRGLAFVGALAALEEVGILPQIKRCIGSSAGAIFAGLVACKLPHRAIAEEIYKTNFAEFQDSKWGISGEGMRLVERFGLYEGEYFYNWYGDILQRHVGKRNITFAQVFDKFGIELVITSTDLTKKRLMYMDRLSTPNLPIQDAVRRSMSIPILFTPVKMTDEDGLVHLLVDGSCTNNFPLHYFDQLYPGESGFHKTLGFNLEAGFDPFNPKQYIDETVEITSLTELIVTLITTIIEEVERLRLTDQDYQRIVEINTRNYKTTNFNMSRKDIEHLIRIGYDATMDYWGIDN
jgi:NTE family protein